MQYMRKLVYVIAPCTAVVCANAIAAEVISVIERGLEEEFGTEGYGVCMWEARAIG